MDIPCSINNQHLFVQLYKYYNYSTARFGSDPISTLIISVISKRSLDNIKNVKIKYVEAYQQTLIYIHNH